LPAAVGQPDEHFVAGRNAVAVVDVLQVIDVEQQQGEHVAAARRALGLRRKLREERRPRQGQRQRVERRGLGGFCELHFGRFGHRTMISG
jgi:hypothetical protein